MDFNFQKAKIKSWYQTPLCKLVSRLHIRKTLQSIIEIFITDNLVVAALGPQIVVFDPRD